MMTLEDDVLVLVLRVSLHFFSFLFDTPYTVTCNGKRRGYSIGYSYKNKSVFRCIVCTSYVHPFGVFVLGVRNLKRLSADQVEENCREESHRNAHIFNIN